jgi:chitodextrinase
VRNHRMLKKTFFAILGFLLLVPASAVANHTAPTGLTVTGRTDTSVSLDWNNYTRYRPYNYRVRLFDSAGVQIGARWTSASNTANPPSQFTWTGLQANTSYQFAVAARAISGHLSRFSAKVGAVTGPASEPPPPPPPPPVAQCNDGQDNDGDRQVDLNDPGCTDAQDNDETNPAEPPSPTVDSDGDGVYDPNDVCPNQSGRRPNNGCPAETAPVSSSNPDGDASIGSADFCPNAAGDWPDGCRPPLVSGGGGDSGSWEARCQYSHSAMDDSIVNFGQPGVAHLHDFIGNLTTDAFSTNASLRAGATNCDREAGVAENQNRSAYWVPALIVNGGEVKPTGFGGDQSQIAARYMLQRKQPGNVQPFSENYKVIAGISGGGPQVVNGQPVYSWTCADGQAAPPTTPNGWPTCNTPRLNLTIRFPDCTDGRDDSPNHRNHAAYAAPVPGTETRACPASHPIELPQLHLNFRYPTTAGPDTHLSTIMTSSGDQTTTHADFMNGWDMDVLRGLVRNCINRNRYCGAQDTPVLGHG